DDDVIQNVMMGHYRSLVPCVMSERHKNPGLSDVNIDFVVLGTGKVKAVRVNGQGGNSFSGCIHDRMQSFGFPKFNGNKTIASWSMSMRCRSLRSLPEGASAPAGYFMKPAVRSLGWELGAASLKPRMLS